MMINLTKDEAKEAARWFKNGDVGLSSRAIFLNVVCGLKLKAYPLDPADFRRCYLLMEKIPAIKKHFKRVMWRRGNVWKLYVKHWDSLCQTYVKEAKLESAPKLYTLMQKLREKARKMDKEVSK